MALNYGPQLQNWSQYCSSSRNCNSLQLQNTLALFSLNHLQFPKSKCNLRPWPVDGWNSRSISCCLRVQMAEGETWASSSSSEKVRLVDLKLPALTDENIKSQVKQTHRDHYLPDMLFQPLLLSIQHILNPASDFVDSILLSIYTNMHDKKVSKNGIELENSNLFEIISALSELKKLRDRGYFDILTLEMGKIVDKADEMLDEINVHEESIIILQILSNKSWNEKTVMTMGSFVLKFVELWEFLLHGPNQSSIVLVSSMAALKENPVSIVGSPLEKFQQPLDQLNRLIKITLELSQYTCDLTLLYSKEELVSTAVHWAILSAVAGYIQIILIMDKGEVALDLSHLISNISHILKDVKHDYTICKPKIEALFEEILDDEEILPHPPIEISEVTKRSTYSKDDQQSVVDGSTMSIDKIWMRIVKAISFPFKHLVAVADISEPMIAERMLEEVVEPMLPKLYSKYAPVALVETVQKPITKMEKQSQVAGALQNKPSSGFQGLFAMVSQSHS